MEKLFTPETIKELDKAFRNIHQDQLKDAMPLVTDVYIDLPLLVDYKLGALFLLYTNQEEVWNYIQEIIRTKYNDRYYRNIINYFDQIPITEEDLLKVFEDPYFTEILSSMSPITSLHNLITEFILDISISNNRFRSAKEATFNLYLNNPYFELSDIAKASWVYVFKNCTVNLHFINDKDYTHESIELSEYIFIDNLSLFNQSPLIIKLFEKGFIDKSIYSSFCIDDEEKEVLLTDEKNIEFFDKIKEIMDLKTDFNFLHKQIFLEEQ